MFEFLGLFFEIIYTTLLELLYSFFIAPLKTLYYIIAIDLDPFAFVGLIASIYLIYKAIFFTIKGVKQLIIFGLTSYQRKIRTAKQNKNLQLQEKRQKWEAYNREFDELYQKYVVSDNSKK
mgnify:CR=1 FL=1